MPKRLDKKARQYIIRKRSSGTPASRIAADLNITPRHVRRLWARFLRTGTTHARMGRPRSYMTGSQIRLVSDEHDRNPAGVVYTARQLRKNHDISM